MVVGSPGSNNQGLLLGGGASDVRLCERKGGVVRKGKGRKGSLCAQQSRGIPKLHLSPTVVVFPNILFIA